MNTTTLFGGRSITVTFEPADGAVEQRTEEIRVRQIKLKDYERGFSLIGDEIALAAFCVHPARDKAWAETLTPESYEALHAAAEEVNANGFFVFAARRARQIHEEQERQIAAMSAMPPEAMKLAFELGNKSVSGSTLPGPRPR